MVVFKKIIGAAIALGLTTNVAFAGKNITVPPDTEWDPETCIDILGLVHETKKIKRKEITQEWLENLNVCQVRPTGTAAEKLERSFGLTENSTSEEYEDVAKTLKNTAKVRTGTTAIYVPGFGSVPASVQSFKTGPASSGDPEAQYLLGYIYANGLTGKVKKGKAKKYLKRAAAQGNVQARELLEEIENN